MIEPIIPEPSDVNALLQFSPRRVKIREVHLPPFVQSSAIRLPPLTAEDLERARECLPSDIRTRNTGTQRHHP
jgi:hypothetical protein